MKVFFLMEYCPNGDLSQYLEDIKDQSLTPQQITYIIYRVLGGIKRLNQIHIMHREYGIVYSASNWTILCLTRSSVLNQLIWSWPGRHSLLRLRTDRRMMLAHTTIKLPRSGPRSITIIMSMFTHWPVCCIICFIQIQAVVSQLPPHYLQD